MKQLSVDRIVLAMMLVVSVSLNVTLAYKLRGFMGIQAGRMAEIEASRLKSGTTVPLISAKRADVAGNPIETIDYRDDNRPTVLYVLSPTCGWCARNESSVKKLIGERGKEFRFIALSLAEEEEREYGVTQSLGIPLYTGIGEDVRKAYGMGGTPQTIVISPRGAVIKNWYGAYFDKKKESVEDFFHVRLPDIKLKSQTPSAPKSN